MIVARPLLHSTLVVAAIALAACSAKHDLSTDSSAATPAASSATAGSPDDYGPPADVSAVRAAWHNESDGHDTIPQIVVVKNYGVVEVRNGGPNSPFFALFERDSTGTWTDQGLTTGQVGLCGLSSKMIPDSIARAIVAHDHRLAANQRANPNAGCSGAI
jgi:hypothetical protein